MKIKNQGTITVSIPSEVGSSFRLREKLGAEAAQDIVSIPSEVGSSFRSSYRVQQQPFSSQFQSPLKSGLHSDDVKGVTGARTAARFNPL